MLADKPSDTYARRSARAQSAPRTPPAGVRSTVDPELTEPGGLAGSVRDERLKLTVFAVIAFIAIFMCFILYWYRAGDVSQRAGDVSQAKTEADCQKAGGMWDMNMCMEK